MLPIRTERLILRGFRVGDAPALAAYRSDERVARYQSWTPPYPLAAAESLAREMMARGPLDQPAPGEWNQIAIQPGSSPVESGSLLGDCAFRLEPGDARQASIGFTIATAHQRRGYATEAVHALIRALLNEVGLGGMGLTSILAVCDAANLPSQRVLERVGMRRAPRLDRRVEFKGAPGIELTYELHRSGRQPGGPAAPDTTPSGGCRRPPPLQPPA